MEAWYSASYQQVLELVQALPEEDIFAAGRYPWTGPHKLVGYIAANTCNHYRWAKTLIRKWVNQQCRS